MKGLKKYKVIAIILIIVVITSCPMDVVNGFAFDEVQFSSVKEACEWIYENIEYKQTKEIADPQTTLKRRYGDCTDVSILLMAIIGYQKNDYSLLHVELKSDHAVVEHNGKFYDCTAGDIVKVKESEISKRHTYHNTMWFAYQ